MRILFIGTGFYQYDQYIQQELHRYGEVRYINSKQAESNHSFLFNICDRIKCTKRFGKLASKELQQKIESLGIEPFDLVFIIKGEYLTEENILAIKRCSPCAKYILYLWDAWVRHDNRDVLKKHFSNIYSFDARDCQEFGFNLRPLFYINKVKAAKRAQDAYNISFVGGDHSGRLDYLKTVKKICQSHGLTYKFKLLVGRAEAFKSKWILRDSYAEDVITRDFVPYSAYLDILDRSIAVVDIPNPLQSGLTIRTIEALSRGAKVVTTNTYINCYDRIPKSLILIVDSNNIDEEQLVSFISSPSIEMLDDYYSLEHFIKGFVS